jgi:putative inorganic carbon (HCO3(-)) transporter
MLPIAYRLAISLRPYLPKWKFWTLMLMPITAAMTVVGASSRGSQVAMAFQAYHTFLRDRLSFKRIIAVGLIVAIGVAAIPKEQLERFRSAGSDETSQQRLLYWKHGFDMLKENPVMGVGFYNFAPYYARHYPEDILFGSAQLPHNIFIQVGTDAGIAGLFIYCALIVMAFRSTSRIRKHLGEQKENWLFSLSLGYDAAMIGFLIAGQFVTIAYYPFMWVLLAFIVATKKIALQDRRATPSRNPRSYLATRMHLRPDQGTPM